MSHTIHPTAIIDPQATLGEGIEIGAHVIIEGQVQIGARCRIKHHAILTGPVQVGDDNVIGYGAVIGALPQDLGFDPSTPTGVRIGEGNVIREYVTIHRATIAEKVTEIADNNYLMTGSHLGHDVKIGNHVIMANNCLLAGHVQVSDRVVIGGGSVFHQFMRIGSHAMVKGGCRFGKDIPPYLIATGENQVAGVNVIGLRRAGYSATTRSEIREAYRLLYRSGLNVSQALATASERSWSPEAAAFFDFVRGAGKRGICDAASRGRLAPGED